MNIPLCYLMGKGNILKGMNTVYGTTPPVVPPVVPPAKTDKRPDVPQGCITALLTPWLFVTGVVALMWRSWWLYPTWAWFIVPLGVPQITFLHFAALVYLLSHLTSHTDLHEDKRPISWSSFGLVLFVFPMLAWAILRCLR